MPTYLGNIKTKLFDTSIKIKKGYVGDKKVFSAGGKVTYYIDGENNKHEEEIDTGVSCLDYEPSLSGYEFVGWRKDNTASSSVETSVIMDDSPITLYAVFRRYLTATFISGDTATEDEEKDYQYYNNGNATKVTITAPSGRSRTGWSNWRGWSDIGVTTADATPKYNANSSVTIESNVTIYGLYSKNVRLTYVVSGVSNYKDITAYYNSCGIDKYDTFTIADPPVGTNDEFLGWSTSASSTTKTYDSISNLELKNNLTIYSIIKYADVTLKVGSSSYSRDDGVDQNVITGINGINYGSLSIGVGDAWVETGRWAEVCSARAILRVKTSSGAAHENKILHEMCWESGHWTGEPYQEGTPIRNTSVTMSLDSDDTSQTLSVVFDGDATGGYVVVNTVTAIGNTVVG